MPAWLGRRQGSCVAGHDAMPPACLRWAPKSAGRETWEGAAHLELSGRATAPGSAGVPGPHYGDLLGYQGHGTVTYWCTRGAVRGSAGAPGQAPVLTRTSAMPPLRAGAGPQLRVCPDTLDVHKLQQPADLGAARGPGLPLLRGAACALLPRLVRARARACGPGGGWGCQRALGADDTRPALLG
jgi:hypothetical protein